MLCTKNTSNWVYGVLPIIVVLALFCTTGCSDRAGDAPGTPPVLRLGVLPDEHPERVECRHVPLAQYLKTKLGVPCRLVVPESYSDLLAEFNGGNLDIALFGGVTFAIARKAVGAVALVMRNRDLRFTSYYLVRSDNTAARIEDLRGSSLAFGSRMSTSGHIMPRHFMMSRGIEPEGFFSTVKYSGSHDATAYMVRDGVADVGAADADVIDQMFSDGRLWRDDVRILEQSPPYADHVWAARPEVPSHIREAFIDAMLALSRQKPQHRKILDALSARLYERSSAGDFEAVERVMTITNPSPELSR